MQDLIAPDFYNIAEDIDRHADEPSKIALYWEDENGNKRTLTYLELRQISNQLANGLQELGLRKGNKAIILLPRIPETYVVYLACLKMGLILMPGSEMLMAKDILYRANHAGADAVICYHALVDRVEQILDEAPSIRHRVVVGGERAGWISYNSVIEGQSELFAIEPTKSSDTAFISYTSGTTGNPKGVIHTHSWAYAHQRVAGALWMGVEENDVVWATAGPGWAKWVWSPFVSTLAAGAAGFVYLGRFNPENYLALMDQYQVNVLCCTPTEYRLMAKVDGLDRFSLQSLHSAVSAGEPLNREVIDTFRKYFNIEVRDGYGQTENTLLVGILKGMEIKAGSMGKPTPGNQVAIVDEYGNPVDKGTVGDIAVHRSAPALFKGYYNDTERTAMAFRGDWYITGDQAREDEDGYFWFEGRSDDIIISAGYTIGPYEVEDALVKHPEVKECAVVGSPDEVRGHIVKAFVVLKDPVKFTEEEQHSQLVKVLQDHVKQITAPYKYPREIEFVDELPKTTSGKIRRIELRQMEREKKRMQ